MTLEEFWTQTCTRVRVSADAGGLKAQIERPITPWSLVRWQNVWYTTEHNNLFSYYDSRYRDTADTVSWSQITVPAETAVTATGDGYPDVVRLGEELWCFEPLHGNQKRDTISPIRNYVKIKNNPFVGVGPRFRLSRMHSVVVSDKGRIVGLLSTYVPGSVTLREALQTPAATEEQKAHWKAALEDAARAMHDLRLCWNCAHLDCIMVDSSRHGCLQIRQCGGRRPERRHGTSRLSAADEEAHDNAALARLFADPLWN